MFQIQTHGFKELSDALRAMPDDLMINHIQQATYAGCEVVQLDAIRRAPIHKEPYPASRSKSFASFKGALAIAKELTTKFQAEFDTPIGYEYLRTKKQRERSKRKLAKAIKRTVHKTLGTTGRQIWNQIREVGTLRKSIIIKKKGKQRRDLSIRQIGIMNRAYYANWIELGFTHKRGKATTHIPAYPFLRPALYENKEKIIDIMRDRLRQGLKTSVKM